MKIKPIFLSSCFTISLDYLYKRKIFFWMQKNYNFPIATQSVKRLIPLNWSNEQEKTCGIWLRITEHHLDLKFVDNRGFNIWLGVGKMFHCLIIRKYSKQEKRKVSGGGISYQSSSPSKEFQCVKQVLQSSNYPSLTTDML